MVLWVDKYRPSSLSKCELHSDVNHRLQRLVDSSDFPHLLFYGPSGGGKKTRIHAILREVFGAGAAKVRVQVKSIRVKSKHVDIATLQSNYHIELSPAEAGNNDRHVVQEVIKELAQTTNVASSVLALTGGGSGQGSGGSSSSSVSAKQFKVVILNEVDRLSMAAQQALRRTMEKYTYTYAHTHSLTHSLTALTHSLTQPAAAHTFQAQRWSTDDVVSCRSLCCACAHCRCRLILVCESLSRVIPPLRSRCLPVRVAAPRVEDIQGILQHIAKKEDIVLHDGRQQ